MKEIDPFQLELATRAALHGMLLEQLFLHLLEGNPRAKEQWAAVGDGVVKAMGSLSLLVDAAEDHQVHFLKAQREMGQKVAQEFVQRVARQIGR